MAATRWLGASALVILAAGPISGQIAEADRYIRLGTRLAPLPPGEGGQLVVSAPVELCADASHLLELRLNPEPGVMQPVARLLTGPSRCRWDFDGLPAGDYDAVIQVQRDGRIVATARGQVWRGVAAVMTLEPVQVEVEGRLTLEGLTFDSVPLADGLYLVFRVEGSPHNDWSAPLDANGSYRVKLGGIDADQRVCTRLERVPSLNSVYLKKCGTFSPGLQRFDIEDVRIPPGVLRIEVSPLNNAGFNAFARLSVNTDGRPENEWFTGFKLLRGIRGDYIAELDREHQIIVTSHDGATVLASSRVTLTSEQPVADVKLTVRPVR